jgi:hypothetical protein
MTSGSLAQPSGLVIGGRAHRRADNYAIE